MDGARRRKSGTLHLERNADEILSSDETLDKAINSYLEWAQLCEYIESHREVLGPEEQDFGMVPTALIDVVWHAHIVSFEHN